MSYLPHNFSFALYLHISGNETTHVVPQMNPNVDMFGGLQVVGPVGGIIHFNKTIIKKMFAAH
jgi:hypothetical protein